MLGTATRVGAAEFGDNEFEVVESTDDGHHDVDRFIVSNRSESALLEARSNTGLYLGGVLLAVFGIATVAFTVFAG